MKLKIIAHRPPPQRCLRRPFDVVLFQDRDPPAAARSPSCSRRQCHCAVSTSPSWPPATSPSARNSWRGDDYEPDLVDAITAFYQAKR